MCVAEHTERCISNICRTSVLKISGKLKIN